MPHQPPAPACCDQQPLSVFLLCRVIERRHTRSLCPLACWPLWRRAKARPPTELREGETANGEASTSQPKKRAPYTGAPRHPCLRLLAFAYEHTGGATSVPDRACWVSWVYHGLTSS